MCVATPVRIKSIQNQQALLEDGRKVDLSLVTDVEKGDWLLCHGGLAIQKISNKDANEILSLANKCTHKTNPR